VRGTARKSTSFGTFVQILPGVDGLIPKQELVELSEQSPDDLIWVGDDVEAVIVRIDREEREVELGIRTRLRQRRKVMDIWEKLYTSTDAGSPASLGDLSPTNIAGDASPSSADPAAIRDVGPVLVVEDDEHVRLALAEWIRRLGCPTDVANGVESAEERLRQRQYKLILMDIELPGENGLDFIRRLLQEGREGISIAVMSTPQRIRQCPTQLEELGILEVFTKPLALEELKWFLFRLGSGEPLSPWEAPVRASARMSEPASIVDEAESCASPSESMQAVLSRLVQDARADAGAVFHLDPDSTEISTIATVGAMLDASEEAAYHLEESPVKDVMVENTPVFEGRMKGVIKNRFKKLLGLLEFESCVGVPIETGDEIQHALFLFHRSQNAFSRHRIRDARAAATLMSTIIQRETFHEQIHACDRLLTSGRLMAGLGHEVYNKVSGLEIQLRNLRTDWEELQEQGAGVDDQLLKDVGQAVSTLVETAGELRGTVGIFQKLMRADEERALDVNQVVRTSKVLLRPIANRKRVRLQTKLDPDLPPARGSEPRLQQVCLNLMLNAVQQMELISRDGIVRVLTSFEPYDGSHPIKIRFSDSGPGIHKRLQDKIFDLGFSTRPSGTGLGLYMARSLVRSMGGTISIEESFVPLGTTFLVELPARPDG
jgi:signal transduction histidine kinase/DNA-binding NarL/FixJ family response regulator